MKQVKYEKFPWKNSVPRHSKHFYPLLSRFFNYVVEICGLVVNTPTFYSEDNRFRFTT
jgi:hypothetical protein